MEKVSWLTPLVEDLQSHIGEGFISCNITSIESRVHLTKDAFLSTFRHYDMRFLGSEDSARYQLSIRLGSVKYIALINFSEIVELKTTMPSEWEYMQRKIQMEEV